MSKSYLKAVTVSTVDPRGTGSDFPTQVGRPYSDLDFDLSEVG